MNEKIYAWINQGLIKPDQQQLALELVGERTSRQEWLRFIKKTLLLLGLLSLAFGVVFFFAYNWNDMSRMVKFGLVQAALLGVFLMYFVKSKTPWVAQSLLLVATLLIGSLLALFGQTYQTGADPWQLFATWALLILPLVLFSKSEVLWLVLASLLNVSLLLYLQINRSFFGLVFLGVNYVWLFLLLNLSLLVSLEGLGVNSSTLLKKVQLAFRWPAQVLGLVVLFVLSIVGMEAIWGKIETRGLNVMIYLLLMVGLFFFYRYVRKDLLLLTFWALAVMVFVLSFLVNAIFKHFEASGFLLMAITLIAMSAVTVKWIKQLHQTFNEGESS